MPRRRRCYVKVHSNDPDSLIDVVSEILEKRLVESELDRNVLTPQSCPDTVEDTGQATTHGERLVCKPLRRKRRPQR